MSRESEWASDAAKQYPNLDTTRWIVDVSRSGDRVALDDGSSWHVVPSHRLISGNWPRTLKVRVSSVQGRLCTLSAESDRDVQAVYQGLRPLHEEAELQVGPADSPEDKLSATTAARAPERRPPAAPTDVERERHRAESRPYVVGKQDQAGPLPGRNADRNGG